MTTATRNRTGKHVNVGVRNPSAKLNPRLVKMILYMRSMGKTYEAISDELYIVHNVDISPQSIGFICRGERWLSVA
jgi:hypothetical protein